MARKDFDNEIKRIESNLRGWHKRAEELAARSMTEIIDENYMNALAASIKRETFRLECFLYVKRLLDKPVRKKKVARFEATSKLPKEFPERAADKKGEPADV